MEKQLKDYLHLYLGCEVQCIKNMPQECGWTEGMKIKMDNDILWDMYQNVYMDGDIIGKWHDYFKIYLRPITAILNTEARRVHKMYFDSDTTEDWSGDTGSVYFNPRQRLPMSKDAIRIFNGQDWQQGDFRAVIEVTNYLRSIFIDCDGLIDAGLALDATKY